MRRLFYIIFCASLTEVGTRSNILPGKILRECRKCPPGWGVKRLCTPDTATECERCAIGDTYSSHYSSSGPCWPCSRCGVGLYEARKCSGWRDTLCDDCMRVIYKPVVQNHGDFHKKCGYLFLSKTGRVAGSKIKHKTVP